MSAARPARRIFLGCAAMSVASAVAAAVAARSRGLGPVLQPGAFPAASAGSPAASPAALPAALAALPEGDWHVDDMWGPRYAAPVPYMHAAAAPDFSAHVAPVDRGLVS